MPRNFMGSSTRRVPSIYSGIILPSWEFEQTIDIRILFLTIQDFMEANQELFVATDLVEEI